MCLIIYYVEVIYKHIVLIEEMTIYYNSFRYNLLNKLTYVQLLWYLTFHKMKLFSNLLYTACKQIIHYVL